MEKRKLPKEIYLVVRILRSFTGLVLTKKTDTAKTLIQLRQKAKLWVEEDKTKSLQKQINLPLQVTSVIYEITKLDFKNQVVVKLEALSDELLSSLKNLK